MTPSNPNRRLLSNRKPLQNGKPLHGMKRPGTAAAGLVGMTPSEISVVGSAPSQFSPTEVGGGRLCGMTREQFMYRVQKGDSCWGFISHHDARGRPRIDGGRHAQRVAYSIFTGEIPDGHHIHHVCRNPACVNPDHLVAMPAKDHAKLHRYEARQPRKLGQRENSRIACQQGHEYTPENTFLRVRDGYTRQICRTCDRERKRQRYYLRTKLDKQG